MKQFLKLSMEHKFLREYLFGISEQILQKCLQKPHIKALLARPLKKIPQKSVKGPWKNLWKNPLENFIDTFGEIIWRIFYTISKGASIHYQWKFPKEILQIQKKNLEKFSRETLVKYLKNKQFFFWRKPLKNTWKNWITICKYS